MSEIVKDKDSSRDLGIQQLLMVLLGKAWIIVLVGLLVAVFTFVGTFYLVTPKYQSSTVLYVNNNSINLGGLTASDMSVRQELVESYIVILKSRTTLAQIKAYSGTTK